MAVADKELCSKFIFQLPNLLRERALSYIQAACRMRKVQCFSCCLSSMRLQNYKKNGGYRVAVNESFFKRKIGIVAPMTMPKMINEQVSPLKANR